MKTRRFGWHILRSDKRLGYEDGRLVRRNVWMKYKGDGELELCVRGMHASPTAWDAIVQSPYELGEADDLICFVEVKGIEDGHTSQKFVGTHGRVVCWARMEEVCKGYWAELKSKEINRRAIAWLHKQGFKTNGEAIV